MQDQILDSSLSFSLMDLVAAHQSVLASLQRSQAWIWTLYASPFCSMLLGSSQRNLRHLMQTSLSEALASASPWSCTPFVCFARLNNDASGWMWILGPLSSYAVSWKLYHEPGTLSCRRWARVLTSLPLPWIDRSETIACLLSSRWSASTYHGPIAQVRCAFASPFT